MLSLSVTAAIFKIPVPLMQILHLSRVETRFKLLLPQNNEAIQKFLQNETLKKSKEREKFIWGEGASIRNVIWLKVINEIYEGGIKVVFQMDSPFISLLRAPHFKVTSLKGVVNGKL